MKLPSDECHWTLLMTSQHWVRQWLGAVRHQAITWANVDPDLCHHMASLGHSELMYWSLWHYGNMISYRTISAPIIGTLIELDHWYPLSTMNEDLSLHIVSCQQVDYSFVAMAMCYQGSPLVLQITRCSLSSKPAAAAGETRMKQVKVPASLRRWCSGENLDWKKHENFHAFFIMIVTRIVLLWCDMLLMLCW